MIKKEEELLDVENTEDKEWEEQKIVNLDNYTEKIKRFLQRVKLNE